MYDDDWTEEELPFDPDMDDSEVEDWMDENGEDIF